MMLFGNNNSQLKFISISYLLSKICFLFKMWVESKLVLTVKADLEVVKKRVEKCLKNHEIFKKIPSISIFVHRMLTIAC